MKFIIKTKSRSEHRPATGYDHAIHHVLNFSCSFVKKSDACNNLVEDIEAHFLRPGGGPPGVLFYKRFLLLFSFFKVYF